jgi:hypothetical protein
MQTTPPHKLRMLWNINQIFGNGHTFSDVFNTQSVTQGSLKQVTVVNFFCQVASNNDISGMCFFTFNFCTFTL